MSEPTRLVSREGGATDFEKELLGSWDAEQPSDEARQRILAIAGLGVGVAGTAAAVAKVGAVAGGSIAPKAGVVGTAAIVKWLIAGAIAAGTAGMTLAYVRVRHEPAPTAVLTPPPLSQAPAPVVATSAAPIAPSPPTTPAPIAPPLQEPPLTRGLSVSSAARRGPGAASSEKVAAEAPLGEEVSLLDQARRALAGGDAPGALRRLDAFDAHFPHGALIEEAEVLRVESLLAEDDRASAAKVGARFLASHPSSPHAARVRALLARAPSP
jgi:hypothetical protein